MEGEIVGLREQCRKIDPARTDLRKVLVTEVRIAGDDLQPESASLARGGPPNTPESKDPKCLAGEASQWSVRQIAPVTSAGRLAVREEIAGLGEDERDGVGGDLIDRIIGHIRDPDAPRGSSRNVDGI